MPRKARLDAPGALHHIMVRGINRSDIFLDDEERHKYLERLGAIVGEAKCAVYAWVLMSNHVHILFKSGGKGISTVMRKLLTWYAIYHNRKHRRTGHLFENRYKSIICDEDNYLLALIRYIHLNPVRAGMVQTLEELDAYPWSGHSAVMGKRDHPWMDTDYVLLQFNDTRKRAQGAYRKFVQEGISMGRQPQLTGGGLVRSLGGWSGVQSAQRKGEKSEYDERILGSGEFVTAIFQEAEEKQIRQLKLRRSELTMETIIHQECTAAGISDREIRNGGRRHAVSVVRMRIAQRGIKEMGLTSAEIARHLGVSTSTITRVIEKKTGAA
ncbi:MAG: transposase [Nitrospirota bacterium]|nr:transposase [Nitrospirota bacterium]